MLYPLPAVLVSCGENPDEWTMLTISWTGIVCSDPAMCYISVRASRASYPILLKSMEYTINLTTVDMVKATDWSGMVSSRYYNKWKETGLTPEKGVKVACPSVAESPLSIECRVREIIPLGSHHMFVAEVLDVLADPELIDPETGAFRLDRAGLMSYSHGAYFSQGPEIGRFGWSVRKKK